MTPDSDGLLVRVQTALNDPTVRRITSAVTEVVATLGIAFEKPSAYRVVKAALDLTKVVIGLAEIDPDLYFNGDEWARPYTFEFNQAVIDAMRTRPCKSQATTRPGTSVMTTIVDGCTVSWLANQSLFGTRLNEQVYVETTRLDDARAAIRRVMWEHYKDKSIVFRCRRRESLSDEFCFTFEHDEDVKPLHSGYARQFAAYIDRALKGGVTRSLLLWGEPGTGKSCLARAVIDILNMRCLRLRVEDLEHLRNSTLADAIMIFRPDAVIIDDLDRLQWSSSNHLYEMLEFLKRNVKLVFGTVNDMKKVPPALRRPGRFDERRKIDVIDHDVVRAMLGHEFAADFDMVKDWPIAYVEEYTNRRRFMAPEELTETVRELQECMRELREESVACDEGPVDASGGDGVDD